MKISFILYSGRNKCLKIFYISDLGHGNVLSGLIPVLNTQQSIWADFLSMIVQALKLPSL